MLLLTKPIAKGEVRENSCYTILINSKLRNRVLAAIHPHKFKDN
ncbi:hypothetical protein [Anabaena sphaerica]|nr:hypothetical protein [Anabaena sphaerica]